jgi:ribose-phosphate pyrophosphokinase
LRLDRRAAHGGSAAGRRGRSGPDHEPALAPGAGFFRIPADQLQAAPILCDYLRESRDLTNYVLVAGDVGESKDVAHYAARLDLPIAIVDKRRAGDDQVARAVHLIGDAEGKVALIVDDEVASGGTLVEAARFVLDRGAAAVEACVVHPVLSGRAIERIEASPLRQLVVTATIPSPCASESPRSRSSRWRGSSRTRSGPSTMARAFRACSGRRGGGRRAASRAPVPRDH